MENWHVLGELTGQDPDHIFLRWHGRARSVHAFCLGKRHEMKESSPGVWRLTLALERAEEGILSYVIHHDGKMKKLSHRSPGAGLGQPFVTELAGSTSKYTLNSQALGEKRQLTVYLPPQAPPRLFVFCADGHSVPGLAQILEPSIVSGELPAVCLVGIHSGGKEGSRMDEYIPGNDPERFAAHLDFFCEEVPDFLSHRLGLNCHPAQRAVFGYSQGGVFAAVVGLERPEFAAHIIPLSMGSWPGNPPIQVDCPHFHLAAGLWEPIFLRITRNFGVAVRLQGGRADFRERVSGHDSLMWSEELLQALKSAFN